MSGQKGSVKPQAVHAILTGCLAGCHPQPADVGVSEHGIDQTWEQIPQCHNPVFRKRTSLPGPASKAVTNCHWLQHI